MDYMLEAMRVLRINNSGMVSLGTIDEVAKHLKENKNKITKEALKNILKGELDGSI